MVRVRGGVRCEAVAAMTHEERVAYAAETVRLAESNHKRALALWDLIFPPWRWPKWYRESRAVKAGIRETRKRRAYLEAKS
jgi:hypothetical protein